MRPTHQPASHSSSHKQISKLTTDNLSALQRHQFFTNQIRSSFLRGYPAPCKLTNLYFIARFKIPTVIYQAKNVHPLFFPFHFDHNFFFYHHTDVLHRSHHNSERDGFLPRWHHLLWACCWSHHMRLLTSNWNRLLFRKSLNRIFPSGAALISSLLESSFDYWQSIFLASKGNQWAVPKS